MKNKLFLFVCLWLTLSSSIYAQTQIFKSGLVRNCQLTSQGDVYGCQDVENYTVFEVIDLSKINMYYGDSYAAYDVYDIKHEEDSRIYIFYARDEVDNILYALLFDFEKQSIFIRKKYNATNAYLFYWYENWVQ